MTITVFAKSNFIPVYGGVQDVSLKVGNIGEVWRIWSVKNLVSGQSSE